MIKIFPLVILTMGLTGCSLFHIHKMEVTQGNVYKETDIAQLHEGMTPTEVKAILGSPMLVEPFRINRMTYVYTILPSSRKGLEKYVVLTFNKNRLVMIHRLPDFPIS